ncbi:MAG: glycosyltransferase family 2 protein [Acidobacteriota bacterium]|nr:glycosyltransferase family 2 protein [Acidobacteriota bacterium]
MPVVSVIVPCYNQGHLVDEAVESVLAQTFSDFEIIIVNDGSTDEATNRILQAYDKPKTTVLHTRNCGLGGARNNGIRAAQGKYILPLDADDRIGSTYLEKAVRVLEARADVGIVYCEAEYFGERTGRWELPAYKFPDILLWNVIFCSALFRKSDWEQTEGYRANVPAWEDHDFWLSIIELGREVYRIPETLFYYRQTSNSMIKSVDNDRVRQLFAALFRNHPKLYADNIEFVFSELLRFREAALEKQALIETMENTKLGKLQKALNKLKKMARGSQASRLEA